MARIDLGNWARKYPRGLDFIIAAILAAGIIGLFFFDMSAPRGELDGVGYAALVALCVRFGDRTVIACAALTTLLTLLASLYVPDSGISVAGMWANRGFAIAEIWIIAWILHHRLALEAFIAGRERKLQVNQVAWGRIVREALLSDKSQDEQIRIITELAAEALEADLCAMLRRPDENSLIRVINIWDRPGARHYTIPDFPANNSPGYQETMRSEFFVYSDDIRTSSFHKSRLELLASLNIRSLLIADTVHEPGLGSVVFAFNKPHHWTTEEIAFGRGIANLVALFFVARRNTETLAALEQVAEGIYVEDPNGDVRYANRAARELSVGAPAGALLHPAASLAGGADMHELSFQGRDLEIQRLRLPSQGILTRINDVTERNAVLQERRKLEERLQRGAKMEAIGQLAGGVAHDFNNILGAILGFAGFLIQDLPEKSAEHGFAARIVNACERGKGLVIQILAFARVRAVERGVADLGLIVKRNQDYLAGQLPSQITLRVHRDDVALPVFGSSVQLSQLITNLVLNARDSFSDAGGAIDITTRPAGAEELEQLRRGVDERQERLWGEVQSGRAYGLLQVQDQGAGIAPDILDRIFEPFFTTKGRQHGTGLGLAVVHGVVESLGGVCHVRSVPGSGTLFSIYVPLASAVGEAASERIAPPVDLRGKERVLIVDDEADIADMLSIGLERLGYETVSVNDPREALAAFTEDPLAFDIVVTDQVMLGLRGLELIRRLKEIRPAIVTILCTGFSDGVSEEIARQAGADMFFQKPVDSRQVATGLRFLLARGPADFPARIG
ncbi:MAG TPA: ATP-binding protein [Rhizomicrobium sp.]|nr:ATP-binding protein [Rhizomicrobium sp.]